MGKGDGAWSTRKKVLGWDLDTIAHLLHLPPRRQEKVEAALAATPRMAHTTSLRNWSKILGLLQNLTPDVSGSRAFLNARQIGRASCVQECYS